jgi:hypothetical protein
VSDPEVLTISTWSSATLSELPQSVTDPDAARRIRKFHEEMAIPAEVFARAVASAISQPGDVDVNARARNCDRPAALTAGP